MKYLLLLFIMTAAAVLIFSKDPNTAKATTTHVSQPGDNPTSTIQPVKRQPVEGERSVTITERKPVNLIPTYPDNCGLDCINPYSQEEQLKKTTKDLAEKVKRLKEEAKRAKDYQKKLKKKIRKLAKHNKQLKNKFKKRLKKLKRLRKNVEKNNRNRRGDRQ